MPKIPEVDEARAIMTEAMQWSVMKWLTEKKRVRKLADAANLALDNAERELRNHWDPKLAAAYKSLSSEDKDHSHPPEMLKLAKAIRHSHDQAHAIREEAEAIFDKAEKRLSTALARDGCKKAIEGWDEHEQAIRHSEKGALHSKASR